MISFIRVWALDTLGAFEVLRSTEEYKRDGLGKGITSEMEAAGSISKLTGKAPSVLGGSFTGAERSQELICIFSNINEFVF